MTRRLLSFLGSITIVVSFFIAVPRAAAPQTSAARAGCTEWHECRALALDALASGEYERFHDLAWRTVQTGPPHDPALMYLLARAQSLSGRPHDALVMLDRLADLGVATDAATNDEFKVVRTLRDWPDLDAKVRALSAPKAVERASEPSAAPAPARAAAPGTPGTPAAPAGPVAPVAPVTPTAPETAEAPLAASSGVGHTVEDAVRVADVAFNPHGLAYDAVSSRFVVADPGARKLVIFDERSHRALDLVRASSAGFGTIAAFEIDPHRGDLWVVSGGDAAIEATPSATLHRLQLVSGRPIARYPSPEELKVARFDDVAVTASGTVLMLDAAGRRIIAFDPALHTFSVAATLDVDGATSLAPADDRSVYVAYPDGILHVDLSSRTATALETSGGPSLGGFARIRWNKRSLVGVQRRDDGRYGLAEVKLGRHAAVAVVADTTIADPTAVTLAGSDLYVLTRGTGRDGDADVVVHRIRLRQ